MGERSPEQAVVSISLPRELLRRIDARADSLHMPRSRYLSLLAKADVDRGGALQIAPGTEVDTMDVAREITEFLKLAVPALAEYQRWKDNPETSPALSEPPASAAENKFWNDFLDERDQILTLKWIESQKAGKDIGFERAIQLWLEHRDRWKAAHQPSDG